VPTEVWVALISAGAIVVGYLLRPIGALLGLEFRNRRSDHSRRTDFQFETLQALSGQLERWRYAGDTITSETAKAQVEILIFKARDDRLRELVERMLVAMPDSQEFRDVYGDILRRLGEVQREL